MFFCCYFLTNPAIFVVEVSVTDFELFRRSNLSESSLNDTTKIEDIHGIR